MKITHVWSVLCGQSVINSDNNQISLLNLMEKLDINSVIKNAKDLEKDINVPIAYEIVSFWVKSDEAKELKGLVDLSVISPDNVEKKLFTNKFEMSPTITRLRTRFKINGLVVKDNGIYTFVVKFRENEKDESKEVARLPLEILINKKTQLEGNKNVS